MSLLLRRLSKLPSRKAPAFRHVTNRFFFESDSNYHINVLRNGDKGYIEVCKNPDDEVVDMGRIGSSNGWVASWKEGFVFLQKDPNLIEQNTDPKRISLPPLVALPHCQTQIVTNVAISSSSPEDDEECVVAIKFLGPQLSLCRPARSSEWTNIEITDPYFFNSHVMYSERDEMFSMPASGGEYIGSWNLGEQLYNRKVKKLRYRDVPEMVQSEWKLLDSYCTSEHLVEFKPTGQMFLVKWYTKSDFRRNGMMETQHFMVFKLDKIGNAVYTRDIDDLWILLRPKCEPLCVYAGDQYRNLISFTGPDDFGTAHLCG